MRARLDTVFDDLSHLWSDPEGEWDQIDVTPGLQRAWRLATLGLPAEVTRAPGVRAPAAGLGVSGQAEPGRALSPGFCGGSAAAGRGTGYQGGAQPGGGVRLAVWVSGNPRSPLECQEWLNPFGDPGRIQGSLGPALAAAIASQHGGSLTVAPRESGGAVFSLELPPLAEEPHEPVI